MTDVFVTGGTGYIGRPLIAALLARGHAVRALVRAASLDRLPAGATPVIGDALRAASYRNALRAGDTFVQLVGTPHPSPAKAAAFERVDLAAGREAVRAADEAGIKHFVYLSVAHPAPVMRAYIDVRRRVEADLEASGMRRTVLRPWYVLGPGHRWPHLLRPAYALAELVPCSRATARRLGLVQLPHMVDALVHAVEHPPAQCRVCEVPDIRRPGRAEPRPGPGGPCATSG